MDGDAGSSRPKRKRLMKNYYAVTERDIEDMLFGSDSNEEFNFSGDEESSSEDEADKQDSQQLQIPLEVSPPMESPQFLLPMTSSSHQDQDNTNQPFTASSMCNWTTSCELNNLLFTKRNEFFGEIAGINPIDYFDFFFTEEFLKMICTETNAQAERLFLLSSSEFSRITEWKELTVPEFRIFLGLLFHTGFIHLNRLQDYWKTDRLFSIPIFSQQMSRNRFLLIMRCLHFTSEVDSQDPLYKIRKVMDYFNNKMNECYYPAKELSLDESMILWREINFSTVYEEQTPEVWHKVIYGHRT